MIYCMSCDKTEFDKSSFFGGKIAGWCKRCTWLDVLLKYLEGCIYEFSSGGIV